MQKPEELLISVIIPAHNTEAFIQDAIYSVLQQSHKNLEIIVVNDASTDNTLSKVLEINDPRIKVFTNPERLGAHRSRNIGFENATGDFIALLDSDDIALSKRLEKQLNFLIKNPKVDAVSGGYIMFGDDIEEKTLLSATNSEYIRAFLLLKNPLVNPAIMF